MLIAEMAVAMIARTAIIFHAALVTVFCTIHAPSAANVTTAMPHAAERDALRARFQSSGD
ncbi:MAG: hypothetical protein AB7U73_20770 [Pirellulales bacterium]